MKAHILVLLAVLASLTPPSALALGGQDISIDFYDAEDINIYDEHQLAVADDGTFFHVIVVAPSHGEEVIRVYRSTNGGSTWSTWGEISDPDPDVDFLYVDAEVATGTTERLLIAYTRYKSTVGPDRGALKITSAPVADTSPNWSTLEIEPLGSDNFPDLSLDVFPVNGGNTRVHLGYLRSEPGIGWSRTFRRSLDGGATWSAAVVLGEIGMLPNYKQDIASDEAGVVHWVWTNREFGETETTLRVQAALNDGALVGDWATPVAVETSASEPYLPFAVANPAGDGLFIALQEPNQVRGRVGLNGGNDWSSPGWIALNNQNPAVAWGASGPTAAMRYTASSVFALPQGYLLFQPMTADPTGTWGMSPILYSDMPFFGKPALVVDPTRGDEFAFVGVVQVDGETTERTWFDAGWRNKPGYGVPRTALPFDVSDSWFDFGPVAGDIDGDGDRELVLGHSDSPLEGIWRYDLETETATLLTPGLEDSPYREPILVDIDGDGAREIFFAGNTSVHGYRADGTLVPGFPVADELRFIARGLSGGQVTGYAHGEIVVPFEDKVYVLGGDGRVQPGFPYQASAAAGELQGRVAIGDVDGDGSVELVAPYEYGLAIIDGTGALESYINLPGGQPQDPVLADLDGDGDLEIVVAQIGTGIQVLHHSGATFGPNWPFPFSPFERAKYITLADMTGDGRRDIIFRTFDGVLTVLDTDGNLVTSIQTQGGNPLSTAVPIVAELGPAETGLAYGDEDGYLHILNNAGEQEGWPRDFGSPIDEAVVAVDLDGNGTVEMVVESEDTMWVLDMGVPQGPLEQGWRMHGARPNRSNCADCPGYTPSAVTRELPRSVPTLLHPNQPNPFNPSTTIRYEVPVAGSDVRLRVFDMAGRLVHTLVDETRAAGSFTAIWNGHDQAGRAMASGVYLVRLDVGTQSQMRSVVLAK